MLGINETEGSGAFDYNLNGVSLGSITIKADGETDPFKDLLDYELKNTPEIDVFFEDGRTVRFIREDLSVKDRLDKIEALAREPFNRQYKTLSEEIYHKMQALANIMAIFEYEEDV